MVLWLAEPREGGHCWTREEATAGMLVEEHSNRTLLRPLHNLSKAPDYLLTQSCNRIPSNLVKWSWVSGDFVG